MSLRAQSGSNHSLESRARNITDFPVLKKPKFFKEARDGRTQLRRVEGQIGGVAKAGASGERRQPLILQSERKRRGEPVWPGPLSCHSLLRAVDQVAGPG